MNSSKRGQSILQTCLSPPYFQPDILMNQKPWRFGDLPRWPLGASVRFLKAGISGGGASADGRPPRSGT